MLQYSLSEGTTGYDEIQSLGIYWGLYQKKHPNWGQGYDSKNVWGHFGDGETPNFRVFGGENPQNPPNFGDGDGVATFIMFRDTLGTGKPQTLGFFWG